MIIKKDFLETYIYTRQWWCTLVYRVNSRTSKATPRNPLLKNQSIKEEEKKKKEEKIGLSSYLVSIDKQHLYLA